MVLISVAHARLRRASTIFSGVSASLQQRRRRLVDAGIGRLRRQHDRDQERERIDILQFAARIGIGGGKAAERFLDLGFGPLLHFAVRGLGVGLGLRLAVLEVRGLARPPFPETAALRPCRVAL